MPRETLQRVAFNRGLISPIALARVDLDRMAFSCETMTNWMPRTLGSMSLRPGLGYLGATRSNLTTKFVPFIFSASDVALVEFTNLRMRVWIDDEVLTRGSVSTTVSNGTFEQYTDTCTISVATPAVVTYAGTDVYANGQRLTFTTTGTLPTGLSLATTYYIVNLNAGANTFEVSLTSGGASIATTVAGSGTHTINAIDYVAGWTDSDESGASSYYSDTGVMEFVGTGTAYAIRDQTVTVAAADQGDEHALRIVVTRGPLILRVGSTSGGDEYVSQTTLDEGYHSLAFTPTGDFYIRFKSALERRIRLTSCEIEAAGTVELTTPYATADLQAIRFDQSGDILFLACSGYQQQKVERRGTRSWSFVEYETLDGPFRTVNLTTITMTPSVQDGNGNLTASAPVFDSEHVGAIFRVLTLGQREEVDVSAQSTWSDPIEITGVDASRVFGIVIAGTFVATVTLQRSLDTDTGPWEDVTTYTTASVTSYDDGLDNQIIYYRIGVDTGDYTSGTAELAINTTLVGSKTGIARVTNVTSSTVAQVEVLSSFGRLIASDDWSEGVWSDFRGWPTAVALYEGRLWWSGRDRIDGSVSDSYYSYDQEYEGDAGPICRTIGVGAVDTINWILPIQRMILGGQSAEYSCRSNAFDEPLTPTNFNVKSASSQGSADCDAVAVDSRGLYVQRGGTRVFELMLDGEKMDYKSVDSSILIPEIGQPGIVRMAVQRQPDTRIHCVRSDGTVALLVYDRAEKVNCWLEIETDGDIEDAVVLPGADGESEDQVYYVVKRTINGSTVRYLEKWAKESECNGGTLNKQADAFVVFTNSPQSATVTGLTHLEGETVVVWQDGVCPEDSSGDIKTYTVSSGSITLDSPADTGVVGLAYTGSWQSAKLGRAIGVHKNIKGVALVLYKTHPKGLRIGYNLTTADMDYLPLMNEGAPVDTDTIYDSYDQEPMEFPGGWSNDIRLCMGASAPRPVTVLAANAELEMYD